LTYIDPVNKFAEKLLNIDKPARYTGGEFGISSVKEKQYRTLIAFPDLYEIGMGNQAVKIIYNRLNSFEGISCDRAFAPAPDFEKLLRETNTPLYGLDTGITLGSLDLLMFTIGYELGLNGILTMLDVSGIPVRCEERKTENLEFPIIIAGGPAVSNPLPYSPFIDAFWIGEAEAGFFDLAEELAEHKKRGESRAALLEIIAAHPNIWVKGGKKALRAIYSDFSAGDATSAVYPIPSMKIVQNHGTVEIMRGCPNGCRFCHAGFWYRPMRQKCAGQIFAETNEIVKKGGWQQVSLSSLSSGDYHGISSLIENLNNMFTDKHISFQLPSLKISGFALDLLEKISITRKSGITFAVETPKDIWQMAINKDVTQDNVVAIIQEAKKRGWGKAKFYFMIGLPVVGNDLFNEEEEIVSFITEISRRTKMKFNINIGIFIPKPHTPYQNTPQLDSETAEKKLTFIRSILKPAGHKVSISDRFISKIEGLLSRGGEKSGYLCEQAFREGSRLDAWDEFVDKTKWQQILDNNSDYVNSVLSGNVSLPCMQIDSCITEEYLKKEFDNSNLSIRTPSCIEKCSLCGVCGRNIKLSINTDNKMHVNHVKKEVNETGKNPCDPSIFRIIFSFSKEGSAVFHGHLSLIEIFSMAFRRADIPVMYTKGFNPLAKIEFASPLSLGIRTGNEIASADFLSFFSTEIFINNLNASLPDGIRINNAECFLIKSGEKKHSLSSLLWGFSYNNKAGLDFVNSKEEKVYRTARLDSESIKSVFFLRRNETLAKNIMGDDKAWASYFDVYNHLYKQNNKL